MLSYICPALPCPVATTSVALQRTPCLSGVSPERCQHWSHPGEAIFREGTQVLYLLEGADAKQHRAASKGTFVRLIENRTSIIHSHVAAMFWVVDFTG